MEVLRSLRLCTLSVLVSSIVACGGGGGGGSDPAPAPEQPSGNTTTQTPEPEVPETPAPETPSDSQNQTVDATAVAKSLFDLFQVDASPQWFFNNETQETTGVADATYHADGVLMSTPNGTTIYWQPSAEGLFIHNLALPEGVYVSGLPSFTAEATLNTPLNILPTTDDTPATFNQTGIGQVNTSLGIQLPVSFTAVTEIVGTETLDLPIGTYDALHAKYTLSATANLGLEAPTDISVLLETWTVPGIGIVRIAEGGLVFRLTNVIGAIPAPQFTAQAGVVETIAPKTLELDGIALQSADVTTTLLVNSADTSWVSIGTGSEVTIDVNSDGLTAGAYTAAINIIETATSRQWTLPIVLKVQ